MADQTTSSIVVDAPPSEVMAVIADFPAYPAWAKGVTTADVVSELPDGRADQVFFRLDVSPIKDEYTLAYAWSGDEQVTWTLVEGKMLRALDGAYVLGDRGDGTTDVTYRLALDVSIPLIGMLQAQGREDPDRHGAQGPQEARRERCTSAHPAVHRQGRGREVDDRRRDRDPRRRVGSPHAGAVHRRRPLAGRRLRRHRGP